MSRDARDPAYWSEMYRDWRVDAARARVESIMALHDTLKAWEDGGSLGDAWAAAMVAAEAVDDLIAIIEASQHALRTRDFVPVL